MSPLKKITWVLVVSSLMALVLLIAHLTQSLEESAVRQWVSDKSRSTAQVGHWIDDELTHAQDRLRTVTELDAFRVPPDASLIDRDLNGIPLGTDPDRREAFDWLMLDTEHRFSVLFTLLPNGDHYISHPFSVQESLTTYNLSHRPYFQEAVASRAPVISDTFLGADGVLAVAIDVPILNDQSDITSHLGGVFHLSNMIGFLDMPSSSGENETLFLLDRPGTLIAECGVEGDRADDLLEDSFVRSFVSEQAVLPFPREYPIATETLTLGDDHGEWIVVLVRLRCGWTLGVASNLDAVVAQFIPGIWRTAALAAMLLLMISGLGILLAHRIGLRWQAAERELEDSRDQLEVRVTERTAKLMTEITERKRAEEEKLALERQVQHAQKLESLGVMAGGIAHDFNNLLMGILGNADLAMDELSPMSPARGNLEEIEKASKRAADLARQMLAYSGRGQFVIEPIDLNEFVEEMTHLLEVSISKKSVLRRNFADNLPTFNGDVTQIRQIIMNLITNASEALVDRSGVIAISTGAMSCDRAYLDDVNETLLATLDEPLAEGIYAYLEVEDTGCGMDASTVQKVFDPFFTTKFTGRGLGMSAVLGIVRGHSGAIKIQSEVGKGTTVRVLFPANNLNVEIPATPSDETEILENWRGSGTVMIVDDEDTVCAVGKQMLERMGFDVMTARDGQEAVDLFRDNADKIACVLLDLTMPRMDGEEAFQAMNRHNSRVKVLLCSGYNEQDATKRFAGKGLSGFLQKPYKMSALREQLQKILAR